MTATLTHIGVLVTQECCNCGIAFAMTQELNERALRNHSITFYCPAGHAQSYTGKTEAQKLRDQLEEQQRRTIRAENRASANWDEAQHQKRRVSAAKGRLTRLRNTIANGVCPVDGCRRPFQNVRRHIAGQHPDWAALHPDALIGPTLPV